MNQRLKNTLVFMVIVPVVGLAVVGLGWAVGWVLNWAANTIPAWGVCLIAAMILGAFIGLTKPVPNKDRTWSD